MFIKNNKYKEDFCMDRIDIEIDDFINYFDYKGLSKKTYGSYEQTLRLMQIYLKEKFEITRTEQVKEKHLKEYITNLKERGKYTVVYNETSKKMNNPQNMGDFGKKVSLVTINNYIRNIRVYFNYMYENRMIKVNPVNKIKTMKITRKVKEYLEESGMDVAGMSDQEIEEASEVFPLSDHRYLIVEG